MKDKYKNILKNYDINNIYYNEYKYEYVTFSRTDAINVICELISQADKKINIYHSPVYDNNDNYKSNKVIEAINNNKIAKINYYSNFNKYIMDNKMDNLKNIFINNNISFINNGIDKETFHHKELEIDDEVLIFGSFNFLTNGIENVNDKNFYLENVCFWFKEKEV